MRADQARLQLDGLLQQAHSLFGPLLLKSNRSQNGAGSRSGLWIGKSRLDFVIRFLEPALLNQAGGALERLP
jgi:hypothetical protein